MQWQNGRLKDRDYAVAYLHAAIEESLKGDDESQRLFVRALRYIAEAQGSEGLECMLSDVRVR